MKFLDVYAMFIKELRRFMNENKTVSQNVFFIKLKRLIWLMEKKIMFIFYHILCIFMDTQKVFHRDTLLKLGQ